MTVTAGEQCRFDTVTALLDCGIRQPDNGDERFLAASGCIQFDFHSDRFDAGESAGKSPCEHPLQILILKQFRMIQ